MAKRKWTDENLILSCQNSKNKTEVLQKLGLSCHNSGNYQTVDKYIKILDIDISHFEPGISHNIPSTKIPLENILIENSSYAKTSGLKNRLIKEKYLEYKCSICQIDKWNNAKINLQLDHINGVRSDNRLENLRLICPNCHSQTETFCRGIRRRKIIYCIDCNVQVQTKSKRCFPCSMKNKKSNSKILWPDDLKLMLMVSEQGYVKTGQQLGVSDNAVRKRLKIFVDEERHKIQEEINNGTT